MPWKQRKNQRYYYESEWKDGRVRSRYLGRGGLADAAAAIAEDRAYERARVASARAEIRERDAAVSGVVERALDQAAETLAGLGFHRHKRQWRLRRDVMVKVREKANGRAPARVEADAPAVSRKLDREPLTAWVDSLTATAVATQFLTGGGVRDGDEDYLKGMRLLRADLERVARELAGPEPTGVEMKLAEAGALAWFNLQQATITTTPGGAATAAEWNFRSDRYDKALNRFLRVVRMLATVRRLDIKTLMLTVGENQQINLGTEGPPR